MSAVQVTVCYSPAPRQVLEWVLQLPSGATLGQALQASGLPDAFPELDLRSADLAVWGRRAGWQQLLREGDRVEVLRPLKVDPKLARRERFRRQGARAAGLFSRRRPGAKPGY